MTRKDAQLLYDCLVQRYGLPLEEVVSPALVNSDADDSSKANPKHTDNVRDVGSVTESTRKSSAVAKAHALHGET